MVTNPIQKRIKKGDELEAGGLLPLFDGKREINLETKEKSRTTRNSRVEFQTSVEPSINMIEAFQSAQKLSEGQQVRSLDGIVEKSSEASDKEPSSFRIDKRAEQLTVAKVVHQYNVDMKAHLLKGEILEDTSTVTVMHKDNFSLK